MGSERSQLCCFFRGIGLRLDFDVYVFCKNLEEITSFSSLRMKPILATPDLEGIVISWACKEQAGFQHFYAVKTEQSFEQIMES